MKNSYNRILIPLIVLFIIILSASSILLLDRNEVFSKSALKTIDVRDYSEFDAYNLNSDYALIFASVEQLTTDSIGLLNDNKKAIFIFDKDKDLIANNTLSEKIKKFSF